ncbi:unnamed protein product [marine sediment metagenome]|uniref:Uncharacterized protein n=1 Tax=marine sediment metagenome TaxID=412755 RepID=X1GJV8_9ZZZZ
MELENMNKKYMELYKELRMDGIKPSEAIIKAHELLAFDA